MTFLSGRLKRMFIMIIIQSDWITALLLIFYQELFRFDILIQLMCLKKFNWDILYKCEI